MLSQIGHLLIQTVFGVFIYALLLRFYMQWLRAPFRNPVGQFVSALTDWVVRPARRLVPGLFGLDLSSILIAWLAEAPMLVLLFWLGGRSLAGAPGIGHVPGAAPIFDMINFAAARSCIALPTDLNRVISPS